MSVPENCASTSSATGYAMEGGREKLPCLSLQKFTLYQTRSKFYMIGKDKNSDKNSSRLRVLKIDRLEPSDLIIEEDPCIYDANECKALLSALHDGNLSTGGLMSVTKCYGIVGFIKFLEPYYMILITKRRKIGTICGHTIYGISESRIIPVAHSTILTKLAYSKDEQRYKKLLSMVDLTKDFFFSYTYHIMWSLQRNLTEGGTGQTIYERLFVWNEFLTRSIRQMLNNTHWTVALVYGFLKQAKIPLNGRSLWLTLIARRSRHYAGTRYLKRGVNDKGRVANDVETEQIVFEDESGQIASVVQNRGSIPLYWSQEASRFNLRPDIIFHNKDPEYRATKLHFRNLSLRYGNPIIVLNLIKTKERKPRECTLGKEFAKAIEFINDKLPEEDQLKYIQWDFSLNFRRNSINVLAELEKWALWALDFTGFFYSKITPELIADPEHGKNDRDESKQNMYSSKLKCDGSTANKPLLQRGVLRTNCIDCLDRTNVAQYAYGLAVLGHQLCSLGLTDNPKIDPDSSVGEELMGLYEKMGDTLAMQYGGSAAHNKVFSLKRGRWLAMAQSQEFFRTLQRYYRNAYLDAEKQDAINVFLGHFQPHQGKPALWELDSDQHCNIGRPIDVVDSTVVGTFIRSFSEGNVLSHTSDSIKESHLPLCKDNMSLEVEHPEMTPCGAELPTDEEPFSRSLQSAARRQLFHDWKSIKSPQENGEKTRETNLIDIDWLASSGNSCEEDSVERFPSRGHLERGSSEDYTADVEEVDEDSNQATEDIAKGLNGVKKLGDKQSFQGKSSSRDIGNSNNFLDDAMTQRSPSEFSSTFDHWVDYGQTLCL